MSRVCLVLAAVLLTACDKKPDSPTGPSAAARADKSADVARVAERQSAVCKAYQRQRATVKTQLATRASDSQLRGQDTALAIIIADACR